MRLIILEGPDGAGKTTLARQLRELEYIHFGPPPKGRLGAWHQYFALLQNLWLSPRPGGVIIDRFIHGEMIYGPVLRGGTDLTWGHIRMLERVLMGMSAELLVCLPPWEVVCENWDNNKAREMIKDEDLLWDVYDFYTKLVGDQRRMLPRGIYSYTTDQPQAVTDIVPVGFQNKGPGIGLFCPGNTLIVGEEVNTKVGFDGWPFVAHSGSSLWLADLLEEAKIPEHGLYWINSKTNGDDTDAGFVYHLEPDRVIALGGRARVWCERNQIPHEVFEHPQYHKRFKHHEPYPLIEALST